VKPAGSPIERNMKEAEKMTTLTNELFADLPAAHPAPCLSVYQPTHQVSKNPFRGLGSGDPAEATTAAASILAATCRH
jgi:hypothetical protein